MIAVNWLSPKDLIDTFGVAGLLLVVFLESGVLPVPFPGDSLLFIAGFFASTGANSSDPHLNLFGVVVGSFLAAVLGAQVGYWIGHRVGPGLLDRPDRPRLHAGVARARAALDRYGTAKAIVLARFIPVVRTVLNPLAGTVGVPARTFTTWQVVGGLAWSLGVTLAGYALGSRIPDIDHYLLPIVAVIVVVSLIPVALELRRARART